MRPVSTPKLQGRQIWSLNSLMADKRNASNKNFVAQLMRMEKAGLEVGLFKMLYVAPTAGCNADRSVDELA